MSWALLSIGGLFVLVYAALCVVAWRRPLLAMIAYRESVRRKGQSALLICGLLIGSASITASLVGADSASTSRVLDAYRKWGAVDLTVTASDGGFFSSDVAQRLAADSTLGPFVDGIQGGVELRGTAADLDQRLSEGGVLISGFDETAQRPFGSYALEDGRTTYGDELSTGDVLLSHQLAAALDARIGDHIKVTTGLPGDSTELRVAGVASSRGPGSYLSQFAVFMPLRTAQLITADQGINVVRVSARGGQAIGLEAANRAASPLQAAVSAVEPGAGLVVREGKHDLVQLYDQSGKVLLTEFLALTALIVAAGVGLVVNLMLALAEERRPRLAILRALGLSRSGLIMLSILEGALYSVAATTLGTAVGVLVGRQIGYQIDGFFTSDAAFQQVLSVKPSTLAISFAAGALITLATVAAAAYRTSRMSIAAAVRELPELPTAPGRSWLRRAVLAGLGLIAAVALAQSDPLARLGGGVALIIVGAALTRGRLSDRARATLTGLLLVGWAGIVVGGGSSIGDLTEFAKVFTPGVLVVVFGFCIVVAAQLRLLESGLGLAGARFGRLQAALRPPLAYMSRRPVRTGLATGAFALVLVLVTILAAFVSGYRPAYARDSAGFDVRVVSVTAGPIQLPPEIEQQVAAQVTIPMRLYVGPVHSPPYGFNGESVPVLFYGFTDELIDHPPIYLNSRDKRFASETDVWQAMRADPRTIVIDSPPPGGEVTLKGLSGPLHLRIVGNPAGPILDGPVVPAVILAEIQTRPAGTTMLLKTKPGVDPQVLARQIERSLFSQGVLATTTRKLLDRGYNIASSFVTFYDLLLHLGLLVGVLSLAVVGIRASVERRRPIGIMRALGYQPPRVLAGLVAEAALTATIGVACGIGAGVLMSYFMLRLFLAGSTFGLDANRMELALAIIYGTAITVTAAFAWRAARMSPTDAIRHTG